MLPTLKYVIDLLEDKSINLCEIKNTILTLLPNLVEIKDIKTKLEPHKIIGNCNEIPMARIKIKKILENHYKNKMKKIELVKNLLTELEDKSINLTAWKAKALIVLNSLSLNLPTAYAQVCGVNEVIIGSNERKNARKVFKSILEGCVIVLEMQGEDTLLHS